MEPVVATGRNRWKIDWPRNAKTSEIRCRRLPPDGKEGVDGSSPSEVAFQFYGCG